jgi:hypothetical protein
MKNALALAVISIAIGGCGSPSGSTQAPGGAGGAGGGGGGGGSGGNCDEIQLATGQTIPAGTTMTICAGATLTAMSTSAALAVQGTLMIAGTAASPVKLLGQGSPGSWQGIDIQRGGSVSATYLEIHDANVALSARAGSTFTIDHLLVDNSNQLLLLASGGTLAHGTLHGLGASQGNTPVLIDGASPMITDTVVDHGAYGAVDTIVTIGAGSAPVFDRVEVADSHCAFHFNEGTGITISNSFVHHNIFGIMVVDSTDGHVVHNNFEDNADNIGDCGAGSSEVRDNYFVGTPLDSSCTSAGLVVTGTAPASAYTTGVGPSP